MQLREPAGAWRRPGVGLVLLPLSLLSLAWCLEDLPQAAPRILFVVVPSSVQPLQRHGTAHDSRAQAALDTWAKGEQIIFVTQDENEQHGDANIMLIPGLGNLNSELACRALFNNSLQQEGWDWLMRIDDLAMVLPENLRHYLQKFDPRRPMVMGSKLVLPGGNKIFFSGGPGWVVSRAGVKKYMDNWAPSPNPWFREKNYPILMHDIMVRSLGFHAESPREADGGVLFNAYGPVRSFIGPYDNWFVEYKSAAKEPVHNGTSCCASHPISFHYVEALEQRSIWSLLVTQRDYWAGLPANDRARSWNNGRFCAYSKEAPGGEHPVWEFLLHKLQVYQPGEIERS
mmetsp:Transcript_14922/g.41928  ORF Transcript_14922/g.41928 Transcript_14922/m.41928 type:complete len:343 (+) Transcript_14922:102-1130(+)|eukprot:CAMPEP_0117655870 /NCGR_PEP_ID=MMETSP0804-20121206/4506_1 /TAXON_ID=1074897 /ORGANISM="Tetraselmis astigmatica, Strain CCMP880" /LENGTH=342 /DNA_ID=CAMNT_0005462243 /DNA_START=70 /DNA_END=1098 /DNA_ORIENTATION=-